VMHVRPLALKKAEGACEAGLQWGWRSAGATGVDAKRAQWWQGCQRVVCATRGFEGLDLGQGWCLYS
jgi:hypothetical protein